MTSSLTRFTRRLISESIHFYNDFIAIRIEPRACAKWSEVIGIIGDTHTRRNRNLFNYAATVAVVAFGDGIIGGIV